MVSVDHDLRPAPPRRPMWIYSVIAGLVLAAIGLGVFLWLNAGEDGARIAEPVSAADANAIVTYNGETCAYAGPSVVRADGFLTITAVNQSGIFFAVDLWQLTLRDTALWYLEQHGPEVMVPVEELPGVQPGNYYFGTVADAGETQRASTSLTPGAYLLACASFPGGDYTPVDEVGFAAVIDVVSP